MTEFNQMTEMEMPVENSVIWQNSVIPLLRRTVRLFVRDGISWLLSGGRVPRLWGKLSASPTAARAGGGR